MFCQKCGTENADTTKFCVKCGTKMVASEPQAVPLVAASPPSPVPPARTELPVTTPSRSPSQPGPRGLRTLGFVVIIPWLLALLALTYLAYNEAYRVPKNQKDSGRTAKQRAADADYVLGRGRELQQSGTDREGAQALMAAGMKLKKLAADDFERDGDRAATAKLRQEVQEWEKSWSQAGPSSQGR